MRAWYEYGVLNQCASFSLINFYFVKPDLIRRVTESKIETGGPGLSPFASLFLLSIVAKLMRYKPEKVAGLSPLHRSESQKQVCPLKFCNKELILQDRRQPLFW